MMGWWLVNVTELVDIDQLGHCQEWDNIAHLIQECHNSKLSIFQKNALNVFKVLTLNIHSEMKDIKYPPVAIIKGIDVPFILIERAFSVPFYALLNSKTVIFELGHSWIKWAIWSGVDVASRADRTSDMSFSKKVFLKIKSLRKKKKILLL